MFGHVCELILLFSKQHILNLWMEVQFRAGEKQTLFQRQFTHKTNPVKHVRTAFSWQHAHKLHINHIKLFNFAIEIMTKSNNLT